MLTFTRYSSFVANLSKSIQVKTGESAAGKGGMKLTASNPKFMWLFRDVTLNPTLGGKSCHIKDYLLQKVHNHIFKAQYYTNSNPGNTKSLRGEFKKYNRLPMLQFIILSPHQPLRNLFCKLPLASPASWSVYTNLTARATRVTRVM
jgi:hypothetical protein